LYSKESFGINNELNKKSISLMMAQWDYDNSIAYAEKKALIKSREEGFHEAKLSFVKSMILKLNFSDEQIAKSLDISLEFVQKIRAELRRKE
jgi:hypothetical protein